MVWEGVSNAIQKKFKGRGLDWEDEEDLPKRVPWYVPACHEVQTLDENLS